MPVTPEGLRPLTLARNWAKRSNLLTRRVGKPIGFPSRLLSQVALSCLFVAFTWMYALPALATPCSCKQHSASAEASGTCSRTEDEKKCTLSFTTTTPEEYGEFLKRLQSLNLTADPRATLYLVFEAPPEDWPGNFVRELLPVLFAISQRTHFENPDDFLKVLSEIRDVALKRRDKEIDRAIRNREYRSASTKLSLDPYNATISYGCIELQRGKFYAMVKTRWSQALRFCDDFKK